MIVETCAFYCIYLFSFIVILNILIAVGYASFGDDTEGVILDNFVANYADVFKVMLVIHLIL